VDAAGRQGRAGTAAAVSRSNVPVFGYSLFGRLPDVNNGLFLTLIDDPQPWEENSRDIDSTGFADNIRRFWQRMVEQDLNVGPAFIDPPVDRSRPGRSRMFDQFNGMPLNTIRMLTMMRAEFSPNGPLTAFAREVAGIGRVAGQEPAANQAAGYARAQDAKTI
jgi:hypothetical protein